MHGSLHLTWTQLFELLMVCGMLEVSRRQVGVAGDSYGVAGAST